MIKSLATQGKVLDDIYSLVKIMNKEKKKVRQHLESLAKLPASCCTCFLFDVPISGT